MGLFYMGIKLMLLLLALEEVTWEVTREVTSIMLLVKTPYQVYV